METKYRRRNYFIKKAFQLKFISMFLGLIVSGSVLLGWIIYRIANQSLAKNFYQSHLQIKSTWEIIFPAVAVGTLLSIFITGTISIIVVLIFSNKIAGPLYRFEKNLEEVAKGDLTVKTKLRDADELELLADKLNLVTRELNTRIKEIKSGVEKLTQSIQKEGSSQNKEILENLSKVINQFKL